MKAKKGCMKRRMVVRDGRITDNKVHVSLSLETPFFLAKLDHQTVLSNEIIAHFN